MEKNLLKKSGIVAVIIAFSALAFWFSFAKLSLGAYNEKNLTKQFLAEDSEIFKTIVIEVGSDTVARIIAGTSSMVRTGTSSYQYQPRIQYSHVTGLWTFKNSGGTETVAFGTVSASYVAAEIGSTAANYVLKNDGSSTRQLLTDATLAGLGTITASFAANGLVITPAEYSSVNNASSELQAQITTATGSITNHTHTGGDGTTQVSHNNVTGTGTNSHTTIDDFIASKASASGVASLDANSLVVQNPASGTSTPGASKTVMSDGTGKILDGWLSDNVTKLGTPTTSNIPEGSNLYHTDARVNAAVGSLSVNTHSDSNINMSNENDFVKIVGGQLVAGSSSVTVAFAEVTGSATASQLPLISGLLGSASASQIPLISGLLGSATSEQLPPAVKLYATTTTQQAAGAYGQLYVQSSSSGGIGGNDGFSKLLLKMDNPGTSTFVDFSGSAHTVTTYADAIGTTTAKFGSGAAFDGTDDYASVAHHTDFEFGTGDFTIDFWAYTKVLLLTNWFTIGDADGWGYIIGLNTSGELRYACGAGTWVVNAATAGGVITTNTWQHIALVRSGGTIKAYVDGIEKLSNAGSGNYDDTSAPVALAHWPYDVHVKFNGVLDECRISKGVARWTSNFTPPNAPYTANYTQYSAKYADPVNGNTVFEIFTPGTASTEASYIYCNATTTVWGLGTNTAVTGTTSGAYAGWTNRPIRVLALDIGSSKEIKENIKTLKVKPDLLDAEGMAKQNYISNNKIAWIASNSANYTTVVNETGTGSVTVVDTATMESDYNNYIEIEWAADLNQDVYTETIQKTYEKGFWQLYNSVTPKSWNPKDNPNAEYEGFVVEEMPPVVWGEDGQSLNIMSIVAYMSVVQQTLKADTIFALSTLKELLTTGTVTQQKIDYVEDRLEVLQP